MLEVVGLSRSVRTCVSLDKTSGYLVAMRGASLFLMSR